MAQSGHFGGRNRPVGCYPNDPFAGRYRERAELSWLESPLDSTKPSGRGQVANRVWRLRRRARQTIGLSASKVVQENADTYPLGTIVCLRLELLETRARAGGEYHSLAGFCFSWNRD